MMKLKFRLALAHHPQERGLLCCFTAFFDEPDDIGRALATHFVMRLLRGDWQSQVVNLVSVHVTLMSVQPINVYT